MSNSVISDKDISFGPYSAESINSICRDLSNFKIPNNYKNETESAKYSVSIGNLIYYLLQGVKNSTLTDARASHIVSLLSLKIDDEVNFNSLFSLYCQLREMCKENGLQNISTKHAKIDVCGTGGDGKHTLNISTAVSFVLAASNKLTVLKHGNRSVSSKSGSADIFIGLGMDVSKDCLQQNIDKLNLSFLFAPNYHPILAKFASIRKEIGIRTIFNLLGPLINPYELDYQIIGVFTKDIESYSEVLKKSDRRGYAVFRSQDGMDEISIFGPTNIIENIEGREKRYEFNPKSLNLPHHNYSDIIGKDSEYNKQRMIDLFSNSMAPENIAFKDIVCLNAGFAFYISGIYNNIKDGYEYAKKIIDSGSVKLLINSIVNR